MTGDVRPQGSWAIRDQVASRGTGRRAEGGGDRKLVDEGVADNWLLGVGGVGSGVAETGRTLIGVCGGARGVS